MLIILTTVAKKPDAIKLANALVKDKLAACANIIRIEKSVYRWKGKITEHSEFLLLIKTTRRRYAKLKTVLTRLHPYKVPEILVFKIQESNSEYTNWVKSLLG